MDAWHRLVSAVIVRGGASGEFATTNASDAAWQLLGMIDGLNAHALVRWEDAADRGSRIGHAVEGMLGLPRGALAAARD
jgi:hypothetical protein